MVSRSLSPLLSLWILDYYPIRKVHGVFTLRVQGCRVVAPLCCLIRQSGLFIRQTIDLSKDKIVHNPILEDSWIVA
jgi:hypothetical protein